MTAPGMGCLSMGLKGIVASSGGDSQLRSWVPNNGNMEPPGFLPTLTHVALSSQYLLASRVRQLLAPGGKRVPHSAKLRASDKQTNKQTNMALRLNRNGCGDDNNHPLHLLHIFSLSKMV